MAANLYTEKDKNTSKTWFLMTTFLVVIILIGWFASYYFSDPFILYFAVIFSIIMNFIGYFKSDKIALSVSGAIEIPESTNESKYKELHRMTENLCIAAGLKKPRLYIIDDPSPNAFATGRDQEHAAVAVTSGLMEMLDKTELEGVIAHELAHIGNRDILLQTIVVVLVGIVTLISDIFIRSQFYGGRNRDSGGGSIGGILMIAGIVLMILSPLIATMIKFSISRKREFLADATGALITRYPEGLASALEKISSYSAGLRKQNHATAHLFITTPLGGDQNGNGIPDYKEHGKVSWLNKMFMTHPPIPERLAALRGLDIK